MAVILDDDVPLILTLDEAESAPLAPSKGLGQEELPSKSKRRVGLSLSVQGARDGTWASVSMRREPCDTGFAPRRLWVSDAAVHPGNAFGVPPGTLTSDIALTLCQETSGKPLFLVNENISVGPHMKPEV